MSTLPAVTAVTASAAAPPLRVLLGVSGGIAAYKSAELVRQLRGRGHEVRCALTRSATAFVTPLTLEVLTGNRVYQEEYLEAGPGGAGGEEGHIAAARGAGALCIAPATAHLLARLALRPARPGVHRPGDRATGHAPRHVAAAGGAAAPRRAAGARGAAGGPGRRSAGVGG